MAKASKTATPATETDNSKPFGDQTVFYGKTAIDAQTLPGHALMYFLQYGMNKTRQDSVAGMAKAMKAEGHGEEAITAALEQEYTERYDAIISGTLGTRKAGVAKTTSLDEMIRKVAKEKLRNAVAKIPGKKMPVKEEYEALLKGFTAKYLADITAEAERRIATTIGGDDDDLLAGL